MSSLQPREGNGLGFLERPKYLTLDVCFDNTVIETFYVYAQTIDGTGFSLISKSALDSEPGDDDLVNGASCVAPPPTTSSMQVEGPATPKALGVCDGKGISIASPSRGESPARDVPNGVDGTKGPRQESDKQGSREKDVRHASEEVGDEKPVLDVNLKKVSEQESDKQKDARHASGGVGNTEPALEEKLQKCCNEGTKKCCEKLKEVAQKESASSSFLEEGSEPLENGEMASEAIRAVGKTDSDSAARKTLSDSGVHNETSQALTTRRRGRLTSRKKGEVSVPELCSLDWVYEQVLRFGHQISYQYFFLFDRH